MEQQVTDLRVYVASKSKYGGMWQEWRAAWSGVEAADGSGLQVVSSWIDEYRAGETDDFTDLWRRCIDEVTAADLVIAYYRNGDEWKGAFIEIGAALATNTPVYLVGRPPGSWVNHPLVSFASDPDDAVADFAARWKPANGPERERVPAPCIPEELS